MSARIMAQRFAFLLLISMAGALMLFSKAESPYTDRLRGLITDIAAPVLSVVSQPVAAFNRMVAEVREVFDVRGENARLAEENGRLRKWEAVARQLEQENAAFRTMLNVRGETRLQAAVTVRVIGDSGGPFVRTVLVDTGRREGVDNGQAAINDEGLVGRVVETSQGAARILLLTDLNSRVPVLVETTRHRAILAGDNSDQARLIFMAGRSRVRPGDRIVTSGHGGVFPPGLPVGVVVSLADGIPRVQPFVDWHRLEYVRLLDIYRPEMDDGHGTGGGTEQ